MMPSAVGPPSMRCTPSIQEHNLVQFSITLPGLSRSSEFMLPRGIPATMCLAIQRRLVLMFTDHARLKMRVAVKQTTGRTGRTTDEKITLGEFSYT